MKRATWSASSGAILSAGCALSLLSSRNLIFLVLFYSCVHVRVRESGASVLLIFKAKKKNPPEEVVQLPPGKMDPEAFLDMANQVIKLKMFPYFDIAHSVLCALHVREDLGPGKLTLTGPILYLNHVPFASISRRSCFPRANLHSHIRTHTYTSVIFFFEFFFFFLFFFQK